MSQQPMAEAPLRRERRTSPPETPARPAPDKEREEWPPGPLGVLRRHPIATGAGLIVLAAGIAAGVMWYLQARRYESTDDAFIDGRPVYIDLQVSGVIEEVPVTDNQIVRAGDLLVRIDKRDYEAAVASAEAQVEQAAAAIANVNAQTYQQAANIEQVGRQVAEAQAALDFSREENTRYQTLLKTGAGTQQRAQQSESDLLTKQAAVSAAEFAQESAQRQTRVFDAQLKSAQAQLAAARAQKDKADADLSRTELHATTDGRIARLTAAVGQLATPGQGVMILVPLAVWVTANIKETQLADMRAGQPAEIYIDAYARSFPGHVDSIQSGSGTVFSLLPAENATGNYVKVVQRIPVKITFDKKPDVLLGPGMSVVPAVRVR